MLASECQIQFHQAHQRFLRYHTVILMTLVVFGAIGDSLGRNTLSSQEYRDRVSRLYGNTSAIFHWESEMGWTKAKRIPDHHHVSAYLIGGVTTRFVYFNHLPRQVLSFVITPCTSSIQVAVKFWLPYIRHRQSLPPSRYQLHLQKFRTDRIKTYRDNNSREGFYLFELKALHGDSYVHLYAETSSQPLIVPTNFMESSNGSLSKPKVSSKRLRGNRIRVKWDSSPINPHRIEYCIVVNSYMDYHTLCAARGVKFGVLPPDLMHVAYYSYPLERPIARPRLRPKLVVDIPVASNHSCDHSQLLLSHSTGGSRLTSPIPPQGSVDETMLARDLTIGCVGRKSSYIINGLVEDKLYYFDVFAKDVITNLTFPYLKTTIKYRTTKVTPNGLRDSKLTKVYLRDARSSILRFNLKRPCSELSMYVMTCTGDTVYFQLFLAHKALIDPQPIDTFGVFKIAVPQNGTYYVRFTQGNRNTTGVAQVYLSKKNKRFPLPKLPVDTRVHEDRGNRSCDAVTLQWHASPDPDDNEYCIFLKESRSKSHSRFKKPIQCDVEKSLSVDPLIVSSHCLQRAPPPLGERLSFAIGGLHPGRSYVGQLIVRRYKGTALSYDLFQASTSHRCENL